MGGTAGGKPSLRTLAAKLAGIGCIGFGGGSALIPVLQERLAGKDGGIVSESEFDDDVAIACITPGALPVEISAGVGMQACGARGMLVGATAIGAPGVLLLVAMLVLLSNAPQAVITQVGFLAVGISGYIASVIGRYIASTARKARNARAAAISVAIIALAFASTCGKSLYKLLGLADATPLLAIGTVNAMALAFFLACWIRDRRTPARIVPALAVAGLYCLAAGGCKLLEGTPLKAALMAVMLVMALASVWGDAREHGVHLHLGSPRRMLVMVGASLLAALALAVPALILCGEALPYLATGAASSLLSFGGGDAYITMADGMFVEGGMLPEDDFYGRLVPLANALPGSILCKVLAGTGYLVGFDASGVGAGLAMALAGFACAVAMSCITFAVAHYFYEALEGLASFAAIKRSVGCVVSGLLLTVVLSLLNSCAGSAPEVSIGPAVAVCCCLAIAAANAFARARFNVHPLPAVLASAVLSCLVCNLVALL